MLACTRATISGTALRTLVLHGRHASWELACPWPALGVKYRCPPDAHTPLQCASPCMAATATLMACWLPATPTWWWRRI